MRRSSQLLEGRCFWQPAQIFRSAWTNYFSGTGSGGDLLPPSLLQARTRHREVTNEGDCGDGSGCGNVFLVYRSFEKTTHQRTNPIPFFFQREMARVEKMELCAWDVPFVEFGTLDRKDSIVFAPSDQRGGLLFTEILLPIGIDVQIPFCVVED